MAETSKAKAKRKSTAKRNLASPKEVLEFERTHFPTTPMIRHFQNYFMSHKVIDSYYVDLDDFKELVICGKSVNKMLEHLKDALSIEEQVYLNLVQVFYLNIKIFENRLGRIITNVGIVAREFDVEDLNQIIGTEIRVSFILVLLGIFVDVETFRIIFVLFISFPSYLLYRLGSFTPYYNTSSLIRRSIQMR